MESLKTRRMRTQKRTTLLCAANESYKVFFENHRSAVLSCEFHKSGQFLASSNSAGQIHICPTDSAVAKLAYLKGHREAVTEVHYSTDGLDLYSGSKDQTISVWDAFRGVRKSVIIGHSHGVNTVQCSRSTRLLICSGSSDKTIRVWDIRQRECSAMFKSQHGVAATIFSGCGKYIYSGESSNGDITVWDIRQKRIVHVLVGHTDSVTGLSLSPCGKYLASCSLDGTLRKWDVSSLAEIGTEIQSFQVQQGDLSHLRRCVWSPDGRMLATGTTGNRAVVFDANSGKRLYKFDGHREEIIDVAFHPRKTILCSAGADKRLIMHFI